MKNDSKLAFIWIINVLKNLNVPFQITGGLAAIAYGAVRPLVDIDIDIPEEKFDLVKVEVGDFIVYGPNQFKDESWDLMLMTLNYHGQQIDLSGAFETRICNRITKKWQRFPADFSTAEIKSIFDMEVPVIAKGDLLHYKKLLLRPVDLIDVEHIECQTLHFWPQT